MRLSSIPALLLLLCLETACSLGQTAHQTACNKDTVQISPGVVISLSSGQNYQVFPTDNRISMAWLPLDRLIVCPIGGGSVEIINLTARGQKVKAIRIYNWPWQNWQT